MKYILLHSSLLFFFAIKLLRLNSLALLTALICDFRPFFHVSISLAFWLHKAQPQCPRQAPWPLGAAISAGWPSFLLQRKVLKLSGRNRVEFQNLSIFHRNTIPVSFQFLEFINRARNLGSAGEAERGDYLPRPGTWLCSCSWYLIQQKHIQLIPAGSYRLGFWF